MITCPKVLFVTNREDFAIDFLLYRFKDKGIPYLRINSEDITECDITWEYGKEVTFSYSGDSYDLEAVKSVYFRRAPSIFPQGVDPTDTPFLRGERRDFFEGLYMTLEARWVNPLFSTYIAEKKLYQLNVARQVGFTIPKSIVTNRPQDILSFLSNGPSIMKPISHGLQVKVGEAYSIYTSVIQAADFKDLENTFEAPVLVQTRIPNTCDIRATVVGNKVFAVEIHQEGEPNVDWRVLEATKRYVLHELPPDIISMMLNLHKSLGLVYSAFDFILTPDGEYVFLETNPAGEWVWIERETGLPIAEALCSELIDEK